MEIRDISKLFNRTSHAQGSPRPAGVDPDSSTRGTNGTPDGLQLSEVGRVLADLRKAAQAVPEVRSERVQEIRRAIESDELELNPERIAQALLRQGVLADLLGR